MNEMGAISYTSFTVAIVKINEGDFASGVTAHIQFEQNEDDCLKHCQTISIFDWIQL